MNLNFQSGASQCVLPLGLQCQSLVMQRDLWVERWEEGPEEVWTQSLGSVWWLREG